MKEAVVIQKQIIKDQSVIINEHHVGDISELPLQQIPNIQHQCVRVVNREVIQQVLIQILWKATRFRR